MLLIKDGNVAHWAKRNYGQPHDSHTDQEQSSLITGLKDSPLYNPQVMLPSKKHYLETCADWFLGVPPMNA